MIASSSRRRGIDFSRISVAMLLACSAVPSKPSSGKNAQPWWRVNQPRSPVVRSAASSGVKASTSETMSGSLPIWFGALWCRLCFCIHQP